MQIIPTVCVGGGCFLDSLYLADKLVDVEEVFAHISGQDEVDEAGPHRLEHLRLQLGQDVDPCVALGQLEAEGAVMVLQHGRVVVEDCQFGARVTQEGGVTPRVIHVMDYCS